MLLGLLKTGGIDRGFRDNHHPEKVAAQLLKQREHAVAAATTFVNDLKVGALTGPRLVAEVSPLLKDLPESASRDEPPEVPPSGAPSASHMAKLEPLPAAAMSLARAMLCAAAADRCCAASTPQNACRSCGSSWSRGGRPTRPPA